MSVSAEFVLRKKVAEDPAISPRAKALFFYILCQNREKFVFFRERILKALGCCKPAYLKACKELIDRQLICTVQFREKGRVRGLRILIIGIDNIQDANSNTAVKNTAVSNTAVSNIDHIRRSINKKVKEKEGKFLSVPEPEKPAEEIEEITPVKVSEGASPCSHPDNTEKGSNTRTFSDRDASQPTVLQISDCIHQELKKKGMCWTPEEENKRAAKIDAYYSATNWCRNNGQRIKNWQAVVRACLVNDNYRPPKVEEPDESTGMSSEEGIELEVQKGSYLETIIKKKKKDIEAFKRRAQNIQKWREAYAARRNQQV